jgi:hypothetical protein
MILGIKQRNEHLEQNFSGLCSDALIVILLSVINARYRNACCHYAEFQHAERHNS